MCKGARDTRSRSTSGETGAMRSSLPCVPACPPANPGSQSHLDRIRTSVRQAPLQTEERPAQPLSLSANLTTPANTTLSSPVRLQSLRSEAPPPSSSAASRFARHPISQRPSVSPERFKARATLARSSRPCRALILVGRSVEEDEPFVLPVRRV